jgi:hypothetical protein
MYCCLASTNSFENTNIRCYGKQKPCNLTLIVGLAVIATMIPLIMGACRLNQTGAAFLPFKAAQAMVGISVPLFVAGISLLALRSLGYCVQQLTREVNAPGALLPMAIMAPCLIPCMIILGDHNTNRY